MQIRNTPEAYGLISKVLHWWIAVVIIGLIGVGWYMVRLSDEDVLYWRLLDLHEALGLSLFVLIPLKWVWMLFSPNPGWLPDLASWERLIATAVRWSFLAAMVMIPVSGFLFVATNGEAVKLYDLITIPNIGAVSKGTRDWLGDAHYYVSYGCAALIAIHVLAALKHHFIDGDRTLRRMTF